jgi:hypothetical protein
MCEYVRRSSAGASEWGNGYDFAAFSVIFLTLWRDCRSMEEILWKEENHIIQET